MATGAFLDRAAPPATEELTAALGPARAWWHALDGWVHDTYGIAGEWNWSGKDSGWAVRYRRSGKSLLWLHPHPGAVKALVVVGPTVFDEAMELGLTPRVEASLRAAHPYPDGRWLFLAIESDAVVADLERLIALKSPPPRRPRRPAG